MDALCTPTIITGALFVVIISNDLLRHEFEDLPAHSTLGVISILLIAGLCQRGALLVAWGLLLLPLTVFLIIIAVQLSISMTPSVGPTPAPAPAPKPSPSYGSADLPICSDCKKK
jgi:hypothetical protein